MRIMWTSGPSTLDLVVPSPSAGDQENMLVPPRGRFARFSRAATFGVVVIIEPPTSIESDVAAAVIALRFPFVDLSPTQQIEYRISGTPQTSGGAGITNSVESIEAAISGASPFIEITERTTGGSADTGILTLKNPIGSFFGGWIVFSILLTATGRASAGQMGFNIDFDVDFDQVDYIVDVGFVAFMRHWDALNLDDTRSFEIDPIDPSIKQVSDGGQLFATQIDKRRSIQFNIIPSDEASTVISTTPETAGIMTLADQIGTTQPSMWIPDENRAFSPSMNLMGTVRQWPALQFSGNNRWSMTGIIVDELL